ncbi:MAG: cupin domain-containing protein [Nitrososphaerota archaeon]|nr:cupin domain-containing protein [Nitrososphaerota archaeon]
MRTLSYSENCLLVLFKIDSGKLIPLHNHPQAQYGLVISGRGFFTSRNREVEVSEGDSYYIPPNEEHGFRAVEDVTVVDIFIPPRTDYLNFARRPDIDS